MESTTRSFYRLVQTNPPTLLDFTSNQALGRTPRRPDPEVLRLWSGISAYETMEQARAKAERSPWLGAHIAELRVPADGPIRYERTTRSAGHYTLWGEPGDLLACVVSVVPC